MTDANSHDQHPSQPEATRVSLPRTVQQLEADLRDLDKRKLALLAFGEQAKPADMRLLMPDEENVLICGRQMIATLQLVHQVAVLHEVTCVYRGMGEECLVTQNFPVASIWEWTSSSNDADEPVIDCEMLFAGPAKPSVSVRFSIGYRCSVDGTENLVYRIREIKEDEAL